MSDEFTSDIVAEFKANGGTVVRGDVTFRLAQDYGFCWGVERAVAMAFQARKHFPDKVSRLGGRPSAMGAHRFEDGQGDSVRALPVGAQELLDEQKC